MSDMDTNIVARALVGHNSSVSDFQLNKKQGIEYHLILDDLKKLIHELYPNWNTISIEVKT